MDALQSQLQILHEKLNRHNSIELRPGSKTFDLANLNVPGIDDLEQEVHTHPFGTAVRLARRLHELHHNPNAIETASNTKIRKQLALKTTNENKLKADVQNLLALGTQVKQMRAVLKNLATVENDAVRMKTLETEYKDIQAKTPVNLI